MKADGTAAKLLEKWGLMPTELLPQALSPA